jgi:hypothetical protein
MAMQLAPKLPQLFPTPVTEFDEEDEVLEASPVPLTARQLAARYEQL